VKLVKKLFSLSQLGEKNKYKYITKKENDVISLTNFTKAGIMDTNEAYKRLLKRKLDGLRWLRRQETLGKDTSQDRMVFEAEVIKPLAALRQVLQPEEATEWDSMEHIVELFNGRIIIENGGSV